ncbi:MAG: DNA recombination protein RmuC [Fibrobacterales bacterium]
MTTHPLVLTILLLLSINLIVLIIVLIKTKASSAQKPIEQFSDTITQLLHDSFNQNRNDSLQRASLQREELSNSLQRVSDSLSQRLSESATQQKEQLELFSNVLQSLTNANEARFTELNTTLSEKITALQTDNNKRLDLINHTVDEKLHKTLEQRLGHSFKLVSEQLEKVQKGLGEMQTLAHGVGDLKRVLTNVKTKGVLGEYQLANILEQLLTPAQYEPNVKTKKGSDAIVEYAIKLPGRQETNETVWIPIDAKFPTEHYQELLMVYEAGDKAEIATAQKALYKTIRLCAKDIHTKYIDPPHTTDFAILFLPIEGLYAEVLRDHQLFQTLQRDYHVIVAGPTTLSALLNSLQMGFKTLAIEKRSSEVWNILGTVKTEFNKFGTILDKTQKKLDEASKTIESAGVRTRAIERKLRDVEELPLQQEAQSFTDILPSPSELETIDD